MSEKRRSELAGRLRLSHEPSEPDYKSAAVPTRYFTLVQEMRSAYNHRFAWSLTLASTASSTAPACTGPRTAEGLRGHVARSKHGLYSVEAERKQNWHAS